MKKKVAKGFIQRWEEAAHTITEWTGKPGMFGAALLIPTTASLQKWRKRILL